MFISEPMSDRTPTFSIVRPKGRARMSPLAPRRSSYPDDSFPGLLGMLARDLGASGGVAAEVVGTELIAFASLLTQGLADVMWPNGQPISIGANGLVVSPSGSGKSLIYKLLIQPIEEYLATVHQARERCHLLVEDATREAIVQSLHEWPVAGLATDEAGMLQSLLRDAPTLVKLLDGSPVRSARISRGRVTLQEQRFSMLLMEQPVIFEATKRLLGGSKGGVGLINRFFVTVSTDFRARNSPHSVVLSGNVAQTYGTVVRQFLDALVERVERGNPVRPRVKLGKEASQRHVDLGDETRWKCSPGSPWSFIAEYAQRHPERVLRLAGVLHVFEHGVGGEISLDTLQRAESLGNWYVESFARIFYEPPKPTLAETDAGKIEQAIIGPCLMRGVSGCSQADLRTAAFNLGLTSTRFTRALAVLCEQGRVRVIRHLNKQWILFDLAYSPSTW
ncbi:hypothetical protein DP57_688 [Burkholderia pseudomallei]|uniref:DUF3987 domain-containing protein n=1 Tax=Burkholderia pseudomallei TaxID=28450 RepID=UPI00050FB52E|nr:DUF3987 domain-containing protein [Burkholderia pseudomallei]KGC65860.1 hypothetical protein DP57_688 [Burkholderia pseudomallei]